MKKKIYFASSIVIYLIIVLAISTIPAVSKATVLNNFGYPPPIGPNNNFLPLLVNNWSLYPYPPYINPIQNSDGDGNYSVSWTELPLHQAGYYILKEATSADFTVNLRDVCYSTAQYCDVSNRVANNYFYRVLGVNSYGIGPWSNTQTTQVFLPDTPTLNQINVNLDGNYEISWNATARSTTYILQESTNESFSDAVIAYNNSGLSILITGKASGTYYYRVKASGPTGDSNWSNIQTASLLPPVAPFLNPINNPDNNGFYSVTWIAVALGTTYTLQEANDPGFLSPVIIYSGPNLSFAILNKPFGTYYYRVNTSNIRGTSSWSNLQSASIPEPPSGVTVLNNHTTFVPYSYRYVVGEIYNNTANIISYVKIAVNFFDGGQLVATDYSYASLDNIQPKEKACFLILVNNPSSWTNYSFEPVGFWNNGTQRPNLTITTHSGSVHSTDYYEIIGQIQNNDNVAVDYANAVATLYNSEGKVLDCDNGYVNQDSLLPGQISSFDILAMPENPSDVAIYTLQTDGMK